MATFKVLKVDVTEAGSPPKTYQVATVAYMNRNEEVKSTKVLGFVNPTVFATLTDAQEGDVFEAEWGKNSKGYMELKSLTKGGKVGTTVAEKPKGNWETTEERAARQVYIARQSSLANAIKYFEVSKGKPSVDDVIEVAESFVNYVQNGVTGEVK